MVLRSVTVTAHEPQVIERQRDARVVDVLRRDRDDVVDGVAWYDQALGIAPLAETTACRYESGPAFEPGCGMIESVGLFGCHRAVVLPSPPAARFPTGLRNLQTRYIRL